MSTIRRFSIAQIETMGSDTSYDLIFTSEGRMYVQMSVAYEQIFKSSHSREITPDQFSTILVKGVSLAELVGKKLDELLPPKPLQWPDVPHVG